MSLFVSRIKMSWARLLVILAAFTVAIILVYVLQVGEANAYLGFNELYINPTSIALMFVSLIIIAGLAPRNINKPSDFFCFFYSIFVLWPFSAFYQIGGNHDSFDYVLRLTIMSLPLIVIKVTASITFPVEMPQLFTLRTTINILIAVSIIALVYALFNAPRSSGFTLEDSYDRRLEGRDVYVAKSLPAYLIGMTTNGFLPFIAYYAGFANKKKELYYALTGAVVLFYLLGLKSPVVHCLLAFAVGGMVRKGSVNRIYYFVFGSIFALFILFSIEYLLEGDAFSAEIFFRRVFMVPPHIIDRYFDFFTSSGEWSLMRGSSSELGVTYLIGDMYFDSSDANVNTSTFLLFLASSGLPGYLLGIFCLSIYFMFINSIYRSSKNPQLMFLGFTTSLLFTEQAATTALLSSGMGVLTLVCIVSRSNENDEQDFVSSSRRNLAKS